MAEQRLPRVNSDDGTWGDSLLLFLKKEHDNDNTDNPLNGRHKSITIKASDGTSGTAPITFNAGTNLSTAVNGAMEYDGSYFYLTYGGARKKIDAYDTASATGTTYSVGASNTVIFANAASNNVTITLPAAGSFAGYRFYIKRTDATANTVTINTAAGAIDGQSSQTLTQQYMAMLVVSDGTNWYIF